MHWMRRHFSSCAWIIEVWYSPIQCFMMFHVTYQIVWQAWIQDSILSNVHLNASRYRSYKRFTVDPTFCFIIYFQQMLQVYFSLVFQRNSSQTWVPLIIFPFWGPGWWIKAAERPANSISALWITNSSWGQASQSSQSTQKGRWGTTLGKAKKNIASRPKSVLRGVWSLRGVTYFYVRKDLGKNKPRKRNSLRSLHVRTLLVFIRSAMHKSWWWLCSSFFLVSPEAIQSKTSQENFWSNSSTSSPIWDVLPPE